MNHLLHYLETRPETKMKFGLERSHMLYEQVKKNRCPFITIVVGGTNGKGSICSFLASIYQSHGYKVGIFTSPHLVDLRERITVNGMPISEKDFLHYGNLFMKSHDPEEMDASYFETLTFFAYEYFAEKKVEVAIFEVGLGGRLDSTNALDKDAVVLGKVDLDHTQLLGETLEQIAKEKIALVRGHESVVIARQEPSAQKAIEAYMEDRENSIAFEGRDFFHSGSREAFFYEYKDFSMSPLQLGLLGSWQSSNAACALSAALALQKKRPLSTQSMQTGLIKAKLPGRLEMWKNDKDQKVWIDVAHNPAAIDMLCQFFVSKKIHFARTLLSCSADKHDKAMISSLEQITDQFFFYENSSHRSWNLKENAVRSRKPFTISTSPSDALEQALGEEKFPILCTGTFFHYREIISFLTKVGFQSQNQMLEL